MADTRGQLAPDKRTTVEVSNVGGIDEATIEFTTGVTVLSGRNATNRTSFLRAIMAALGTSQKPLKADADEGRVEVQMGDRTFSRTYTRTENGIIAGGSPYLEDPTEADLFAFLLGDNEARRAAERGEDLREIMLRPIDTDEIESEINRLQAERDEIDQQLAEIDDLRRAKTELVEEREQVDTRIEAIRETLEDFELPEAKIEENKEAQERLESLLDELREERSALQDTEFELETERESLEELRTQRGDIASELDELGDVSDERIATLEEQIEDLRSKRSTLETEINRLGTVKEFNADLLEQHSDLLADDAPDDPTAGLLDDQSVNCWTCGTTVDVEAIRTTLELLDEERQTKIERRKAVNEELETLTEERTSLERQQAREGELTDRLESIESRIEEQEDRIADLEAKRARQVDRVEELEAEVDDLEEQDFDELLAEQREFNEREFELDRLEQERARLASNIEEIDDEIDREAELETRREHVANQLEELRMRVQRIEKDAVAAFNEHMEELLALLEYENIERVWIERRSGDTKGAGEFELHVVRSTAEGASYIDTIDHLSESEREVVGLVFALSGYLVHELHETLPFMLLDSLEVIDAERIAALVDYFAEFAECLVVALLPEDAAAIRDDAERITSIG